MINEYDIEDMLPKVMAERLVGKSFGEQVPEAALPSLIQFMFAVVNEAATVCDAARNKALGNDIRSHFGMEISAPCILLKKHPLIKKAQMELDLECGK